MGILYFGGLLALPYMLEQYAYWRFTIKEPREKKQAKSIKNISGYGWAYLWDLAHFILLIYACYWVIFHTSSLTLLDWSGLTLFIIGVLLRIRALRELGEFYDSDVSVQGDHQVISTGPYRYIRHPLHLGTDLQIVGLAFLAPVWLALPLVVASLVLTVVRNRTEDQVLIEHLGLAYHDYYARTWDPVDIVYRKLDAQEARGSSRKGEPTDESEPSLVPDRK
jgi:protein-S-isoprenylcysteine O-methyltransferase Ste14